MPEVLHSDGGRAASVWKRSRAELGSYRGSIELLVLFLLAGWLAFDWFETIHRLVRYYNPLPTWDYWRTAAFLEHYKALDITVLWRQHNEHRIVFPEIVFAADYLLLHGRQLLPLAVSFLCYLANWLVLAWAFWASGAPPFIKKAGILLAGIIIGWQGSAAVLGSSFLLQWTLMQAAVVLSLAFLSRLNETKRSGYLAGAIVSAVIATYSSGNGMLLWPVLLAIGFLVSLSRRQLTILSAAAILSIGIYFIGYEFVGKLTLSNFVRHPIYSLEFIASYLSMPFGGIKSAQFGVNVGLVSLCVTAVLAIFAGRAHLLASRPGVVLFGWYVFTLLTAVLTAAGRMDLTDTMFSGAKAFRYLTIPLVTWAVFILICLWICSRFGGRIVLPATVAFVIAVLLLIGLPKLRWWLADKDATYANEQRAALAIDDGIVDQNVLSYVFPHPDFVKKFLPELQRDHLSVFYKDRSKWLGQAATKFAPLNATTVTGEITYMFPVAGGTEVTGWADDSALSGRTEWILLVNERGRIAGFGRKFPAGFPGVTHPPHTPASFGWVGFVNLQSRTESISAYVVNKRGLLPIPGSVKFPSIEAVDRKDASMTMAGIEWRMDPSWKTGSNLPIDLRFGPHPAGTVYQSWSGSDENTGEIRSSSFARPDNGCLILPVLAGPRASSLSVEIMNAETGEAVEKIPLEDGQRQWSFWRVSIPAAAKRLQIVARDEGKDWGEWLAIAQPSECQ